MKSVFITIFCSLLTLNACSTIDKTRMARRDTPWSSSDPLSIPYRERLEQFEKGNLVINPSFETGCIKAAAPANSFRLEGWERVGQNVEWIPQESEPKSAEEVNSGRHSIRIDRKKTTELDKAEGIISDYIPVIPGNYYFTYRIRLKDIVSNKYRLGAKLYDTLVIKVLFFDQHREPVDPGYLNPKNHSG